MNQIEKNTVSSKAQVADNILFENQAGKGRRILFVISFETSPAI